MVARKTTFSSSIRVRRSPLPSASVGTRPVGRGRAPPEPARWRAVAGRSEARPPSRRCRERPPSRPDELAVVGVRHACRLSTEVAPADDFGLPTALRGTDRRRAVGGQVATSRGGRARRWRAAAGMYVHRRPCSAQACCSSRGCSAAERPLQCQVSIASRQSVSRTDSEGERRACGRLWSSCMPYVDQPSFCHNATKGAREIRMCSDAPRPPPAKSAAPTIIEGWHPCLTSH